MASRLGSAGCAPATVQASDPRSDAGAQRIDECGISVDRRGEDSDKSISGARRIDDFDAWRAHADRAGARRRQRSVLAQGDNDCEVRRRHPRV